MIVLQNVAVEYGRRRVLEDIDLTITTGESVAIVGESGAGKSTVARVLLGLVSPSRGSYRFDGQDVQKLRGRARRRWRRTSQAVLQNPSASLNPRVKIAVSVAEPLIAMGKVRRSQIRRVAEELLGMVGLDPVLAGRYPRQLSGGQRQRVVIARALGARPEMLLLDEPVSALDASARAQILNVLDELKSGSGLTTVYITHDLATVGYLCDRIIVLFGGMVVEDLPIAALLDAPDHPYTRELRQACLSPVAADSRAAEETAAQPAPASGGSSRHGCPFAVQCRFAQPICLETTPEIVDLGSGWLSRCHFAGRLPATEKENWTV